MFGSQLLRWSVLPVAGLLALTACSGGGGTTGSGQPSIVVGAYPFAYVAEQVAGDNAEVTNLLAPGADGHDLELTPQQVAAVAQASLVIYQSDYQAAMDDAVDQQATGTVLDTGSFLTLLSKDEEETHEHEEGEDHDHGAYDPHVWLDPTNMAAMGEHVAEALAEIDPANADQYRANAAALTEKMTALDTEFSTGLAQCEINTFVTNHAAFGYLAHRYDLEQVGISGFSTEEEPSPARIAEVQQIAKEHNVTTIFTETAVSPKVAEAIAGDLGLTTEVLDPLETLSSESAGSDYVEVMESNLSRLKAANRCR